MELDLDFDKIEDFILLVYLCAAVAHQTGTGFDALFVRIMFVLYVGIFLLRFLVSGASVSVNGYFRWQILFLGYLLFSCLWADPEYSTYYFTQFIQILFLTIALTQRIQTQEDVRRYLTIYYISLIYMIFLLCIRTPTSDWGTENLGSALGLWRNSLGLYSATGFVFGLYFSFKSKKKTLKIINVAVTVVFAYVAVLSGSRKGLLMLPVGFVLYWLLCRRRNLKEVKELIKVVISIVVIVVILNALFQYLMSSDLLIAKRLDSMIDILIEGGSGNEGSIQERNFYIEKAQELFSNHIVFGAGSNGFAAYMDEIGYNHVAYCHNNFWELLSTLGLIGFLIYYYMHAVSLYRGFPGRKDLQSVRPLAAVLWVTLAVTVVFGWWFVYYMSVTNNYLFVLAYMLSNVNRTACEDVILVEEQ